jgi:hypothetical protein
MIQLLFPFSDCPILMIRPGGLLLVQRSLSPYLFATVPVLSRLGGVETKVNN